MRTNCEFGTFVKNLNFDNSLLDFLCSFINFQVILESYNKRVCSRLSCSFI